MILARGGAKTVKGPDWAKDSVKMGKGQRRDGQRGHPDGQRLGLRQWGVVIYKSISDPNVTIVQPRDLNFRGRTTFI